MPCTYLIDKKHQFAELTSFGQVTKEQLVERFKCLLNDPDWEPGYAMLSNYAAADCRQLSSEDMDELVALAFELRSKLGSGKCAFVVSSAFTYALTRMCALKGGETLLEIGCFWSRGEALDWLGCHHKVEAPLAQ